jgi:transcriptional regulator with XRE-family HTH domain
MSIKKIDNRFEEVFKKDLEKYGEVGVALQGLRAREGLTQKELAKRIKVSQHHISEMENKKRIIGREIAKRLENEFNINYKVFL